ncbi:MAG: FAD-dependent urate hydroxylase HpxO [Timaviella obliquedivisa GSE-PSE-MK23-08B]|jgi:FAD-dependent urate hydroxylase|nr:FAD-dependent urate hydroxylase HpxO [Timaviella obliquedivisa GSE-PSE-MK23-08B]
MENLKAIVIGAGIGGLTAGVALHRAGYQVEIYDRVSELRPAGAGISLWSNGVKVLNSLGLGKAIAKIGGQMNRMQYRSLSGELLNNIPIQPLIDEVGQRPYPVARTDLQQMLLNAFPGKVRLNARCVGVEESEESVTAIFEDGHRTTGDVLIAADGLRSRLRQYVVGQEVQPRYAGYVNWNGLVTASEDLAPPNYESLDSRSSDTWTIYVGEGKRVSMMPVSEGRFYFFLDVPLPLGEPVTADQFVAELTQFFLGWCDPVQALIQQLNPWQTNRIPIHDIEPLQGLVRGKVALLGDSGHGTTPDLGQGGCQAMEDVNVLVRYLITTNLSVEDALKRYELERKQRTKDLVLKARKRADQIHGKDWQITQQWYEQLKTERPEEVTGAIAKTILGSALR